MAENKQVFQVRRNLDINGRNRVIDFTIDKRDPIQQITLQITENTARLLTLNVTKEIITDAESGTEGYYMFTVDVDRATSNSTIHLMAEIVDRELNDFWWFKVPENTLTELLRDRGLEAIIREFVRDVDGLISKYMVPKKEEH